MYEDSVTEILAHLDGRDQVVVYDFLLKPFNYTHNDIGYVSIQETYGATRPDLVIHLDNGASYRIEVKINNAETTVSEMSPYTRDLFIVPSNYQYKANIPASVKKTTWTDFFRYCDSRQCKIQALNALRYELGL